MARLRRKRRVKTRAPTRWSPKAGTSDSSGDSGAAQWAQTAFDGANIVPALAIDAQNPNTVYIGISAGSAKMGFFRTKDAGKNWTKLAGTLPDRYAGLIAIHPQSGTLLANPGVEGIWRSTDGGENWAQVATDPGGYNGLLFHPTGNMVWTVTSQQGCFRSGDGGLNWARTLNTDLPLNQFSLGPLAFDGTKLYLGTAMAATASTSRPTTVTRGPRRRARVSTG